MQELATLPDFGKIGFHATPATPLRTLLPNAPPASLDFVAQLLRWNPAARMTAAAALAHPFLCEAPPAEEARALAALAALAEGAARHAAAAAARWAPVAPRWGAGGGAAWSRGGGESDGDASPPAGAAAADDDEDEEP